MRSSAEPPNSLNATTAAARLAANSTPSTIRATTRGSLKFTCRGRLKFLGIVHTHAIAPQGLGLRRRQAAVQIRGAEQRRFFQLLEQLDHGLGRFRADVH